MSRFIKQLAHFTLEAFALVFFIALWLAVVCGVVLGAWSLVRLVGDAG